MRYERVKKNMAKHYPQHVSWLDAWGKELVVPKAEWVSSVQMFIDRVDLYVSGGETRCSVVWSVHLFWV